ncbi:flagellar basal-body rod protein FlgB [Psychrobacillus sp. OK028]|uniref:flagellar basal body rod protein FlgB n=1 Tax=Psychrobacillus sp. OK028 TaxID=1884359 RepID=UPI00088BED6F|nr:flagellar basal body rod protein FlgB [Psychrobacillus sp. OK028]SDM54946.1 flagellar basal-body rod protein FlgB [Psychrobacillus sp. OK028]
MSIFGGAISSLERGLDFSATKQKAIAQNIANVDTPNYKAKSVSFGEYLSNAKQSTISAHRTQEKHINFETKTSSSGVFDYASYRYNHNGNGVDMDKEQANLATNQIYYNALIDRMSGKLNTLQTVIKGGG